MLAIFDLEIRRNEMIKSRSSKLRSFEFIFGMMLPKPLKYQVFFYKNEENKMHLKKKGALQLWKNTRHHWTIITNSYNENLASVNAWIYYKITENES